MQSCILTIVTEIDGAEQTFSQTSKVEIFPAYTLLSYIQDGDRVSLRIEEDRVLMNREGNFCLSLLFHKSCKTQGKIGAPEAEGSVEVETHSLNYRLSDRSLLLAMKYTLYFDFGKQNTKLRLIARFLSPFEGE